MNGKIQTYKGIDYRLTDTTTKVYRVVFGRVISVIKPVYAVRTPNGIWKLTKTTTIAGIKEYINYHYT